MIVELSEIKDILGNIISLDSLYRGLVTLLDWSFPRLASNGLMTASAIF